MKCETDSHGCDVMSKGSVSISDEVAVLNNTLQTENANLHQVNTSLHEKNHFLSLKYAQVEEKINAEVTKNEELQNKVDDLDYELTKCRMRNGKLETTLAETQVRFVRRVLQNNCVY
jgi:E3 ubiquitin-protein ligase BRE1